MFSFDQIGKISGSAIAVFTKGWIIFETSRVWGEE